MPYRPVNMTEFVDMYIFGPSHMLWAIRNSLAAHEAHGLGQTDSADALRTLLPKVSDHIRIRSQVLTDENRPTNPLLVTADRRLDVIYSQFVQRIRQELVIYDDNTDRGRAAKRMLDSPLGMPITAVIHTDRIEQEALLRNIVAEIEEHFLDEVETLELESLFQLLKEQLQEFVALMTLDAKRTRLPTRTELEEERRQLQAEMNGCMFRIFAAFPGFTKEEIEMRAALLGPFAIQNDRIGEYQRRRRGGGNPVPPAVDADTGEILEDREDSRPAVILEPQPALN